MDISSASTYVVLPQRPAAARPGVREQETARPGAVPVQEATPRLLATPDQLRDREREAQALRVQRVNNSESLPLNTQKALSQYQQNQSVQPDSPLGELAGIDVFA
jgi:hypothetical protein